MISLYILLIAIIVAIFGLFVTIFSKVKKVDRSKRMGHFFLFFGIIVALVAGFSINKEHEAHQAALEHQKQIRADQMYDAELVHLSAKKVQIKDGQAQIKIHVSKNTAIKITSSHKQLHDLNYKPNKVKKDILVTFVMSGKYKVTATRGENKVVKHIKILKDNDKQVAVSSSEESSSEESSSEVTSESSSVEEPVVPDTEETSESSSSEVPVPSEPETPESTTPDTGVEQSTVPEQPSYQPVWTPSYDDSSTTGNSSSGTSTSESTDSGADSATTSTADSDPASSTGTESIDEQDTAQ